MIFEVLCVHIARAVRPIGSQNPAQRLMKQTASCKIDLMRKMVASPKAYQAAAIGVSCQFLLMPMVAYLLTLIFGIKGYSAAGVLLAGTMPGGSSSNIFAMWSQGVLELSVFMTISSTILSFGMTPLWLYIFSHAVEGIDASSFAFDQIGITFALLLVPLAIGVSLNFLSCMHKIRRYVEQFLNVFAVIIFVAAIVVLAVEYPHALKEYATWQIYVAAAIFFPIATGISYAITSCRCFQMKPSVQRTIIMEVGLQNLALAFAVGEASVSTKTMLNQALPFPLLYAMFMYAWGALLIPVMRRQKRRNEENGVVDADPDFFVTPTDDENNNNDSNNNKNQNDDVVIPVKDEATGKEDTLRDSEVP